MVYFGRETAWQPAEGKVPGPDERQIVNTDDADDADDADDIDEEDGSSGVMLNG